MFGKVKESGQGVPPNIYIGTLEAIDPVPANPETGFKAAFKFSFKVIEDSSGDKTYAGSFTGRIPSGEGPTTKNGLGRFLAELTGIPVAPGVDYDESIKDCFGKKYTLVVKPGPSGGTRVDTIMPSK